jgi:hypothetical protein
MEIVEGRSELWEGIGEDKKECIRGECAGTSRRRPGLMGSISCALPDALP